MATTNDRIENKIKNLQNNVEHCQFELEVAEKLSKSKKISEAKRKEAKAQIERYQRQVGDYQAEIDVLKSMKE